MKSQMDIMNKLLLASGTLMLPLISGQAQKQDSPSKTPNVVFIMADDWESAIWAATVRTGLKLRLLMPWLHKG